MPVEIANGWTESTVWLEHHSLLYDLYDLYDMHGLYDLYALYDTIPRPGLHFIFYFSGHVKR